MFFELEMDFSLVGLFASLILFDSPEIGRNSFPLVEMHLAKEKGWDKGS